MERIFKFVVDAAAAVPPPAQSEETEEERRLKKGGGSAWTVKINERDHGRIIGKKGATIKELESQFSVRIGLEKGSEEVKFEGTDQNISSCLSRISQIIGYVPVRVGPNAPPVVDVRKDLTVPVIRQALFFPDPTNEALNTFLAYLKSARKSILVCCYTISDERISGCLIDAHKSGVLVRVITDNDTVNNQGSDVRKLAQAGIDVRLDGVLGEGDLRAR